LNLHRSMFYKRSTYIYISFSILVLVVGSRHPAAAAGTPMCGRDPGARSRRAINGSAGRAGCRLGLVRYTPCFWSDIRPVFG
jgi:hypothetical protein